MLNSILVVKWLRKNKKLKTLHAMMRKVSLNLIVEKDLSIYFIWMTREKQYKVPSLFTYLHFLLICLSEQLFVQHLANVGTCLCPNNKVRKT